MNRFEGIKVFVTQKLCEWGPIGSWSAREYMLESGDDKLVDVCDKGGGWSVIIASDRYEELLKKEKRLQELEK